MTTAAATTTTTTTKATDGQTSTAAATTDASAAAPAPTDPTAYYDAFWRYVQYYGEDAARAYYGAWSPPAGTPNPYAGTMPAAATAAAPATTAATAGGQQQQHQLPEHTQSQTTQQEPAQDANAIADSSVRKVSNLPAWMKN